MQLVQVPGGCCCVRGHCRIVTVTCYPFVALTGGLQAEAVRGGTKPAAPATPAATPKPAATGAAAGAAATPAAPDAGAQQDQAAAAEGHEGQGAEAAAAVQADAGAKPEAMEVDAGAGAGAAAAEEASPAAAEGEKGEQKEAGAGTEAATAAAPATEGKEQGKGKGAPAAAALRGAGGWSFAATQEALATVAAAGESQVPCHATTCVISSHSFRRHRLQLYCPSRPLVWPRTHVCMGCYTPMPLHLRVSLVHLAARQPHPHTSPSAPHSHHPRP